MGAFSSASRTGLSRASLETRERTAPSFFAREKGKGKRKEKNGLKVIQALAKVLWWIIKLPVLPLILGWKNSKGKKAGVAFRSGGKEETMEIPGLGRLLHTVFYAIPLYMLYVVIFYVAVIVLGVVMTSINKVFSKTESKDPAPIVEQTGKSKADNKEASDVLLDK